MSDPMHQTLSISYNLALCLFKLTEGVQRSALFRARRVERKCFTDLVLFLAQSVRARFGERSR